MKYVRVTLSVWGVECRLVVGPFSGPWAGIWLDSLVLYPPVIEGHETRVLRAKIVNENELP